jgi:hypothetical protein
VNVLEEFELVVFDDRDLVVVVDIAAEEDLDIVRVVVLGIELAVVVDIVEYIPLAGDNRDGLVVRGDEISDVVEGELFQLCDMEDLMEDVELEGQRMGYLHLLDGGDQDASCDGVELNHSGDQGSVGHLLKGVGRVHVHLGQGSMQYHPDEVRNAVKGYVLVE